MGCLQIWGNLEGLEWCHCQGLLCSAPVNKVPWPNDPPITGPGTVPAHPCVAASVPCQPTWLFKQAHHILLWEPRGTPPFDTIKPASHSPGCSLSSQCGPVWLQCLPTPVVSTRDSQTVIISSVQCWVPCVQPSL